MKTENPPIVTMADLVEQAQKMCRGYHFCANRLMVTDIGQISFEPCPYNPPDLASTLRPTNFVKVKTGPAGWYVLEHFLKEVRESFPGVPFQLLYVFTRSGWMHVEATKPEAMIRAA